MSLRELALARLAAIEKQREETARFCPASGRLRVSGPDKTPQSHISLGIEAVRTPLAVRTRISSPDSLSGPDKCGQPGQPDSPDTSDNPDKSDGSDKHSAVARLCAGMAAENERRREWWTKPVEGWREGRLIIRSVMTGKTNVIYLRSKGARK